jgi:hypothetical protein
VNLNQVVSLYSNPTEFEERNGIKNTEWELFEDYGDIKFFINRKSDGSSTFLIIFRAGKTDNWCGWCPNERQCQVLIKKFPSLVERINEYNIMIKNGW